jgi:Rrf2 family iron-sulfur cluster assembly transcriptional regulator
MNFSRECEYALKGMVALAHLPVAETLTLQAIAAQESLPAHFLSKIFQKLLRHGLIRSHRGVQRGYTLTRPAPEITLRQVLEAIEGPDLFDRCMFSRRLCGGGGQCTLHPYWGQARSEVAALFGRIHLQEVADSRGACPAAEPGGLPDEPAWIRNKVQALYS